jgi:hypothetical protein
VKKYIVGLLTVLLLLPAPRAGASTAAAPDPEGDTEGDSTDRRVDITEIFASYDRDQVTVGLKIPAGDPRLIEMQWIVKTDKSSRYSVYMARNDWYVSSGDEADLSKPKCKGTGTVSDGRFIAVFNRSCLGDPTSLMINAQAYIDNYNHFARDRAPDSRYAFCCEVTEG